MLEGFQQFTEFTPNNYLLGRLGLSDFEGAREIRVVGISRTGVLTQRHQHFILNNRAAVSSTNRLVLGAFTLGFGPRIQFVIPEVFYPLVLTIFHFVSSAYIIAIKTLRARGYLLSTRDSLELYFLKV